MFSLPRCLCVLAGILLTSALASPVHAKPATAPSDPGQRTAEEKEVAAWLEHAIPVVKFDAVGFSDVIDFLRDVSGANIFVNWKSLEAAGIDKQAPVSANLRNVKFGKALQVILDGVGGRKGKVTYEVDSGVISISAVADVVEETVSKAYDIRFLVPEKLDAAVREKRVAALVKLVQETIGAPVTESKGELTVVQTAKKQKLVENLIKHLQELMPTAKP